MRNSAGSVIYVYGLGRLWTRKKRVEELMFVAVVFVVEPPRFCHVPPRRLVQD